MSKARTYTIPQAARRFNLTEEELVEALKKEELTETLTPRWMLSDKDIRLWLLRKGRITFEQFQREAEDL